MEAHLEAQQPTQTPMQQVYRPPPPQTAPYVPSGTASAPADGKPSWMDTVGGLSMGAAKIGIGQRA